jgi:hypothetical protein
MALVTNVTMVMVLDTNAKASSAEGQAHALVEAKNETLVYRRPLKRVSVPRCGCRQR